MSTEKNTVNEGDEMPPVIRIRPGEYQKLRELKYELKVDSFNEVIKKLIEIAEEKAGVVS